MTIAVQERGCLQGADPMSAENIFERLKGAHKDALFVGPPGSGKSYWAYRMRECPPYAMRRFMHVNCGGITSTLFETQVFGHIKGAFTGADRDRDGYCATVKDGILFLDEIGDLPLDQQAKLLVLLENRIYTPVGSCTSKPFNGKVLAATNRNLPKMIKVGAFRQDLLDRLSTFVIPIKPLRERREIIPDLIARFLKENRSNIVLDAAALEYLTGRYWRGNIRELKSVVDRIVTLSGKATITAEDAALFCADNMAENIFESCDDDGGDTANPDIMDLPTLVGMVYDKIGGDYDTMKKQFMEHGLEKNKWCVAVAARDMKMGRNPLIDRMEKYGITRAAKKKGA